MANVEVSEKARELANRAEKFVSQEAVKIMSQAAEMVRDFIKTQLIGQGSTGPRTLSRNTGEMERNTVAVRAKLFNGGVQASVAINVKYASIHFSDKGQKTTVIVPKSAKSLTIPLVVGADKRAILPARSSAIQNKFALKGKLYGRLPGGVTRALFTLKDSVTVKSRIDVDRDIQPFASQTIKTIMEREAQKFLGA